MSLPAENFRAVGIKGQGSIFNIIDTTPVTGGTALTALTGFKTFTIGTGWTLNVGSLVISNPGSFTVGPLTFNYDGSITYNTNPYIHVTTPPGTTLTNLGVGINTLANVTAGTNRNTAVGNSSMENSTTGSDNTAVGHSSLNVLTTGLNNVAVGRLSGAALTTGDGNTLVGSLSGSQLTTEDNCVLLNNDGATVAQDGEVHIGNATDQSLTFLHSPLVADRMTSSTGPAAIPVTSCYHEVTTTGADALTLADGTPGQHIVITMVVDGGNATITPDNFAGGGTLTLANVGDSAHLMFTTSAWVFLGGLASTTPP